jgi:hypothetical protein
MIVGDLNFNWGHGLITPFCTTRCSARFVGYVKVDITDNYSFSLSSGGQARLLMGGMPLLECWDAFETSSCAHSPIAATLLRANVYTPLVLEFRHLSGAASLRLSVATGSGEFPVRFPSLRF